MSKKYIMLIILFEFFLLIGFLKCSPNEDSELIFDDNPPTPPIHLGDPFILLDNGIYYMYGTTESGYDGIEVYRSNDLKTWEGPVGVNEGVALHNKDVWGDKWFWAPEVYQIDDQYYMFFSTQEHIAVAVADDPKGPFVQQHKSVLKETKAIDNHLFIDDDGQPYIAFANFKDGLRIWGAEMNDDLLSIKDETMKEFFGQSQEWEKSPKEPVGIVNEGPFILKHEALYYMFYSANHYQSPDYGIGFATAEHPMGPWTKNEGNPILQNPEDWVGTGHCSFFKAASGQLHIVYHAHYSKESVHPRRVLINQCQFVPKQDGDRYTLEILDSTIEPKLNQSK